MRLVPFLFATALAMCLVVGMALLIPEATGEHGFVHPDHASMSKAPPSLERHAAVLWFGWGFGVLQIIFYMGMMALGARKGVDLRGLKWPIIWGGLAYAVMWTLVVVAYTSYRTDDAPSLFLTLPLPTALFVYGLFPLPVIFVIYFCVGYKRWILTDEDLQAYKDLVADRRARHGGEAAP